MANERTAEGLSLRSRISIGIIGGLCAILLKLYAHDIDVIGGWVLGAWRGLLTENQIIVLIGYGVIAALVMFLGGLVGFIVDESNRLKMLALGMSAPAMLTTLAGGIDNTPPATGPADSPAIILPAPGPAGFLDGTGIVSRAFAGEENQTVQTSQFNEGVKLFFGQRAEVQKIVPAEKNYWVIVGSTTDLEQARGLAATINENTPEFEAFVGGRKPGNDYYPVIIGGPDAFLPYDEAIALRQSAIAEGVAPLDSYLSDYADRPPVSE